MAKGEKNFSSDGKKVHRFEFTPPPIADYSFKLRTSKVVVAKADGPNKVPYINGMVFELLNTAAKEGEKNRTIQHRAFLRTDPNGEYPAAVLQQDGLVALSKSVGVKFDLPVIPAKRENKDHQIVDCEILSPQRVAEWLKGLDGAVGKLRTKLEPDQNDPAKKWGKVDYFIEAEVEAEEEEDEDEDEDETEEDSDDDSDDEDEGDDEDSDEEDSDDDDASDEDEAPKKSKVIPLGKKKAKKSKK